MVPLLLPNLYCSVWVKEPDFRFVVMVSFAPIFTESADTVGTDARAMVSSATVLEPFVTRPE